MERSYSVRSSASSLYRNYDVHLDILKLTGIVVLLAIMAATLALITHVHPCHYDTDCKEIQISEVPMNDSLCSYVEQFSLSDDYTLTVCNYQTKVRIDVRKFIGGHPTILGYFINTAQWNQLKRLTPKIDRAIVEALKY